MVQQKAGPRDLHSCRPGSERGYTVRTTQSSHKWGSLKLYLTVQSDALQLTLHLSRIANSSELHRFTCGNRVSDSWREARLRCFHFSCCLSIFFPLLITIGSRSGGWRRGGRSNDNLPIIRRPAPNWIRSTYRLRSVLRGGHATQGASRRGVFRIFRLKRTCTRCWWRRSPISTLR